GQTYRELRDPQPALRCIYQAESSLRTLGKMSFLAAALNEIGVVHKDFLDNPTSELRFFTEALNIFSINDQANKATVINNIGEAKDSLNQIDDALKDFVESFKILQSFPGHPTMPIVLSNMGHIYYLKGDVTKALACYQPALEIFRVLRRRSQEA